MKFLLLIVVIAVVLWLMASRRRRDERDDAPPPRRKTPQDDTPVKMLACAHCGVHLPQGEAVTDADARAYCSEAHRLAGPR